MFRYTQSQLKWIEVILVERIHNDIWLDNTVEDYILIKIKNRALSINIKSNYSFLTATHSDLPFSNWLIDEGWNGVLDEFVPAPGYSELENPLINKKDSGYEISYDILGLLFWALSRLEEVNCGDLDKYDRFPASSSHALKHGYLERPIVDEWLSILSQVMQRVWPDIQLKQHQFCMKVSHDVDIPSRYLFQNWHGILRRMMADIIKRGDLIGALRAPRIYLKSHKELPKNDPMNTFEWIMDQSDKYNLTSAFYFICGKTDQLFDADYDINHPVIRTLIRRIYKRKHEIGLHPSYNTYNSPDAIVAEANRLRDICAQVGVVQEKWGGRMHFLRWSQPITLYGWEAAGMEYDSTLSYADHAGFRCGTCFEYPAFDPVAGMQLNLRIRPLIAMEVTIRDYMDLGLSKEAFDKFEQLKSACKSVNGVFTLLWHNNQLITKKSRDLYSSLLE